MNIVIADDHAMTRSGVSAALSEMFPTARIIECTDAPALLDVAKKEELSLAIVDLFMPGSDDFGFLKKLCNTYPALPIMVLSASDNAKHVRRVIDIGAGGFVHKSSSFELMQEAISKVMSGGTCWPRDLSQNENLHEGFNINIDSPQNRDALLDSLTKRQIDILACLSKGLSNKAIAAKLCISENTVKTHLKVVMAELGCRNRTEAGVLSEKLGL